MSAAVRRLIQEDAPFVDERLEAAARVVFYRFVRESLDDRAYRQSTGQGHLDFGCGDGRLGGLFLGEFRTQDMVGVDFDPDAVAACANAGLPGGFETVVEGRPLPFADGQFRLITARAAFVDMPSHRTRVWLAELLRVLAPGGLLAFALDPAASAKRAAADVAPHDGEVVRYVGDLDGRAMVIVRKRGLERPRGVLARLAAPLTGKA